MKIKIVEPSHKPAVREQKLEEGKFYVAEDMIYWRFKEHIFWLNSNGTVNGAAPGKALHASIER